MKKILLSFIAISLMVTSSLAQNFPEDENAIIAVIDDFHDAAAKTIGVFLKSIPYSIILFVFVTVLLQKR